MREISAANPCDRCGATSTAQQQGRAIFGLCLECSVTEAREFFGDIMDGVSRGYTDGGRRRTDDSDGADEWPKSWDEIASTPDAEFAFKPTYTDLGPLRAYAGTLYINADGGDPARAATSGSRSASTSTAVGVVPMSDIECPTCGRDDFDTRRAMKVHHTRVHDARIVDTEECPQCGKAFEPRDSSQQYCSHECADRSRRTSVELDCAECGGVFTVPPSQADRREHCSEQCKTQAERDRVPLHCAECGETVHLPPSKAARRKHCSAACRARAERDRVTLTCAECGDDFDVIPSDAENRRHCSMACLKAAWRDRVTVACQQCDTEFDVPPSHADRKYCSPECHNAARREQKPPRRSCDACGNYYWTYRPDQQYCTPACANEARRTTPRPDDLDAHLRELYVEDDHRFDETYRRLNAARDDRFTKDEVRARLKELGVFRENTTLVSTLSQADPDAIGTDTPDGDDSWQKFYQRGESDD